MSRPRFQRFHPSTHSLDEALARATETPREVRLLAEALLQWVVSNIERDLESPWGNLPEAFGFRDAAVRERIPRDVIGRIDLSRYATLSVSGEAIVCTGREVGATYLRTDRFEPRRLPLAPDVGDGPRDPKGPPRPCVSPVDWLLSWRLIGAATRRLAEYERWVLNGRGIAYRVKTAFERPKAARRANVALADLPDALRAIGEWCDDSEWAMLSYIIGEAKARHADAELPPPYQRSGLRRLIDRLAP